MQSNDRWDALFRKRNINVGPAQRELLLRVHGHAGHAAFWADRAAVSPKTSIFILDQPPRVTELDELCLAVSKSTKVLIPFSESPDFDFVKSKLRCHGLIGACPPNSPHQLWWGSLKSPEPRNCGAALLNSHVVSCIRNSAAEEEAALKFGQCLELLDIPYSFGRIDEVASYDETPGLRSQLLLEAWNKTERPLI